MYKVDIPLDTKESAAIARRRSAEEARKLRIFNPKERQFGRDLPALRLQIEEKRARNEQENQRSIAYSQEMCRQDLVALELDRRLVRDRLAVAQNLDEYRKNYQRYEDRREFDLNDVDILKKSYPLRLHDEDPRCGPASLQRFEGEDLSFKERLAAQNEQRRAWLDAQVKEKRQSQEDFEKGLEMYNQRMREMDLRSCQLWHAEMEAQKAVKFATSQYNLALACESQEKKEIEKRAEEEANMAHIVNMCNSELLTETVDSTSVGGPNRVGRDRFKGYSAERIAMIREEQARQRSDRQRRDAEDRRTDAAWDALKRREDVSTVLFDYDLQNRQRQRRVQTEHTNMELAREQRLRQEYLNRVLYRNTPSAEFYDQFNTSTR